MWIHGTFYWNELMTRDPEGAKAFYAEALGWTFETMPMEGGGSSTVAMIDGRPAGGIFEMTAPEFEGLPEHWFSYIAVDDVDARVEKLKAAGGTVLKPPFDVPEVGRIAVVMDGGGAAVGLMTPVAMD